jgi:hypothetical protein
MLGMEGMTFRMPLHGGGLKDAFNLGQEAAVAT